MREWKWVLCVLFLVFLLPWQSAEATTYNELMKRATSGEKPASAKAEEESPVMVNYEVGDTSGFYTQSEKFSDLEEEEESDSWELEE